MKDTLNREDIIKYLHLINDRLEAIGKTGDILLAGGASMALVYAVRDSTHDIDALFEPRKDISKISWQIAEESGLHKDWLNDSVKSYLSNTMNAQILFKLSSLTVKTVDSEGLLAMKLSSARPDTHDKDDAIALMQSLKIENMDSVYKVLEKHIPQSRLTAQVDYFSQLTYQEYSAGKQPQQSKDPQSHSTTKDKQVSKDYKLLERRTDIPNQYPGQQIKGHSHTPNINIDIGGISR